MRILSNGFAIRNTGYQFAGQEFVAVPVASVTFSGLGGTRNGIDILWNHASSGLRRLDLEINGDPAPAGSAMIREQMEAVLATREDRVDPGFAVADLVAVASGTVYRGCVYVQIDDNDPVEMTYVLTEGYAKDSFLILGDRERFSHRMGRWAAAIEEITSMSLVVASGQSSIGVDSNIKVFV
jgi:hypothetical protein